MKTTSRTRKPRRAAVPPRASLGGALAAFTRDTASRGNWGHPGLAKMLRGVGVEEATWRPAPDAHSIWEEVNHIVYWSEDVLERLEDRGRPRKQAWPAGEGQAEAWRRAVARAARLHGTLVRRIASAPPKVLARKEPRSRFTTAQLVLGCASHIAYHVGQIAVLRRLYQHARQTTPPPV